MIAEKDEKKRSRLWGAVMTVSTVLIIGIAAFFIFRLFTGNPLEGKWGSQDSNLMVTLQGNGTAVIEWVDDQDEEAAAEMQYQIDTEKKTLTLHVEAADTESQAGESEESVAIVGVESAVEALEGSYDYSLEQEELTLTEREYGEQMVFMRE